MSNVQVKRCHNCNVEKPIYAFHLSNGKRRAMCGACKNKKYKFTDRQRHASKNGVIWEVTREEFETVTAMPCYYCHRPESGGLDRLEPTGPYSMDNVAPCCWMCNRAKNTLSVQQFIEMCHLVSSNHL